VDIGDGVDRNLSDDRSASSRDNVTYPQDFQFLHVEHSLRLLARYYGCWIWLPFPVPAREYRLAVFDTELQHQLLSFEIVQNNVRRHNWSWRKNDELLSSNLTVYAIQNAAWRQRAKQRSELSLLIALWLVSYRYPAATRVVASTPTAWGLGTRLRYDLASCRTIYLSTSVVHTIDVARQGKLPR